MVPFKHHQVTKCSEYEVVNGFTGMKRDITLRLCVLLWYKITDIRAIFGICREHYLWKSHSHFVMGRPKGIPVSIRHNPEGGFIITEAPTGPHCLFSTIFRRTLFLNTPITEGVFHWVVRINYAMEGDSGFNIGTAPLEYLSHCNQGVLGNGIRTCSFGFWRNCDNRLLSSLTSGGCLVPGIPFDETCVLDGSLVSVEIDCNRKTLSFFVNGKKVPRAFSNKHIPLHFGISCSYGSFTSVSFHRLESATPSFVACRFYKYEHFF